MSVIPKPSVDELISRYMLEPSIQDIYVEGVFDCHLITELARLGGARDMVVYDINLVDIPDALLSKHGLTRGNKQRVIALAREFAILGDLCKYRCIVDRDLDHWLGELEETRHLFYTEFSDLESYYMTSAVVRHLLIAICDCKIRDWAPFYDSFVACLKSCYALRLADRELNWSMTWISFDRCLNIEDGRVSFDLDGYMFRLASSNKKAGSLSELAGKYAASLARLNGDPRGCVRGHDLVDLLAWVNKKKKSVKGFEGVEAIQRLLIASVNEVRELPALLS